MQPITLVLCLDFFFFKTCLIWLGTGLALVPGPALPVFAPEQKCPGAGVTTHRPLNQGLASTECPAAFSAINARMQSQESHSGALCVVPG